MLTGVRLRLPRLSLGNRYRIGPVSGEESELYFPEPTIPDATWSRYADSGRQIEWLDRSTLERAVRIREFLNRSLNALPPVAAANLAHRFRRDPPFGRVFFELLVGRFLQVLGADVDHQPHGLCGASVEATSPAYNQAAELERRRREALLGVVERAAPAGWWIIPRRLPRFRLEDHTRAFRQLVRELLSNMPDPSGYSFDHRLRREGHTAGGPLVLELWPGDWTDGPIAMASMGAHMDDSALRVAVAARAKRHQARAFPGEAVLLAIDAPFGGPDLEDFDAALLGQTVMHIGRDRGIAGYSFRPNGALATQRAPEYAGVLAFGRVGIFGAGDPTLYHHPRYAGVMPAELKVLRQRRLEDAAIRDVPASQSGLANLIGFPVPD